MPLSFRDQADFDQDVILENMVLTGPRGVGKTVLLERFRPMTIQEGWLWVADLSESTSISKENIATRPKARGAPKLEPGGSIRRLGSAPPL